MITKITFVFLVFIIFHLICNSLGRPGDKIIERHKIHVPVKIKTVYVTKLIKVPEHHHHHHHYSEDKPIPVKMKMQHFPTDPWAQVSDYSHDHHEEEEEEGYYKK